MNLKEKFMRRAIALAQRGKGFTAPNPCVGALVVKNSEKIGEGWHKSYGSDHAEVVAIKDAIRKGHDVRGAELFVTLEPCNHYGKTPPCTEFILKHKIKKVYVGCKDPNPSVKGGGINYLRSKGVYVESGILEERCKELIDDFMIWISQKRPYVYLKIASTLDGKIADRYGNSSWITNEKSRKWVHELRAKVDVILIGSNTLYKDNPKLTCRLKKKEKKDPFAVIVSQSLPSKDFSYLYLFKERPQKTIFFALSDLNQTFDFWVKKGVKVHFLTERSKNFLDLKEVLKVLYSEYKCYYVLCEGGGKIANSLLEEGIADELLLFFAPKIIGDEKAVSSFRGRSDISLKECYTFNLKKVKTFDQDLCLVLKPKR